MKAPKSIFVCTECEYSSPKWLGRCPSCGAWNTMEEQIPRVAGPGEKPHGTAPTVSAVPFDELELPAYMRSGTGMKELDRVLGGGLVQGSVILLSGEPGIGKSTLLMQISHRLSGNTRVLYVSGEESRGQLKLRAERLGVQGGNLYLLTETGLDGIIGECERLHPDVIVVDSIQTVYSDRLSSAPGSVTQVRESAMAFIGLAKRTGSAVILVGHVNKEGGISGPKVLEHMVDTVLYFEGDRQDSFRLLRSVKNRFGSTDEIGVFEMRSTGMAEISDPSTLFITGTDLPGCAVTCAMEGTRPMMVEVQALLSTSPFSNPRRMAAGLDNNRLVLLLAVLEKKAGLRFYDKDVYTNVVGGIRLDERACDLAVAMCIAGAGADIALPPRTAILGELSLTGEVRPVNRLDKRIQECARLGFSHIVVPNSDTLPKVDGLNYTRVKNIREALCILGI